MRSKPLLRVPQRYPNPNHMAKKQAAGVKQEWQVYNIQASYRERKLHSVLLALPWGSFALLAKPQLGGRLGGGVKRLGRTENPGMKNRCIETRYKKEMPWGGASEGEGRVEKGIRHMRERERGREAKRDVVIRGWGKEKNHTEWEEK